MTKTSKQTTKGTYEGMEFLPGGSGYNLVTISGKKFYSFFNVLDMPPIGTPVSVEFEERTRLWENIVSNRPCLTFIQPCPSHTATTASGH